MLMECYHFSANLSIMTKKSPFSQNSYSRIRIIETGNLYGFLSDPLLVFHKLKNKILWDNTN